MALKTLPKGMKLVTGPDGKVWQTPKTRSRKRYKTPLKVRNKMAAAARRSYFPIITGTAVGIPLALAWKASKVRTGADRVFLFGREMLSSYSGVHIKLDGSASFRPRNMLKGLVPLLAAYGIRRSRIFSPVNQRLAKMRVPARFN